MSKSSKTTIHVQGSAIAVLSEREEDYLCLTDIARFKNPDHPDDVIRNWLRNRNTLEFLGVWERLNNPDFNPVEFDGIRNQAGLNSFVLTPKKWIEKLPAGCGVRVSEIMLAVPETRRQFSANTRAVPLARKRDAHQGRVFFLPGFNRGRDGEAA